MKVQVTELGYNNLIKGDKTWLTGEALDLAVKEGKVVVIDAEAVKSADGTKSVEPQKRPKAV